ncbi:MAG: ribonuclease [Clostridia bacterium]|jgi:ribonuclease PH|nr:Rph [Clostridiales bacterium]MDK2984541.1 ribonuclease [Clostridia bacterium]
MVRADGRLPEQLRTVKFTRNFTKYAEGSVLVEMGDTKVICNATVDNKVPIWLKGQGKGWITAEYSMLPRATAERTVREVSKGRTSGRTMEIQRLIGRTLRSVVDLSALGERTIWIDCDVIQADGGTRTAAISGGFLALVDALNSLHEQNVIEGIPIIDYLAAVSVGKVEDKIYLDLEYSEDCKAQVDMNVVMTGGKKIVEIQGSAEEYPFSKEEMQTLLEYAEKGIEQIIEYQKEVLGEIAQKVAKWDPSPVDDEEVNRNES